MWIKGNVNKDILNFLTAVEDLNPIVNRTIKKSLYINWSLDWKFQNNDE